jgi:hypothetical protein
VAGALGAALAERAFGFDRATLARLRALGGKDRAAAARDLRALMARRVDTSAPPPPEPLPNLYVACGLPTSLERPQCLGGKLRLAPASFGAYADVLLGDVLNPDKDATLAVATAGVVDDGAFILRPGEKIFIRPAP